MTDCDTLIKTLGLFCLFYFAATGYSYTSPHFFLSHNVTLEAFPLQKKKSQEGPSPRMRFSLRYTLVYLVLSPWDPRAFLTWNRERLAPEDTPVNERVSVNHDRKFRPAETLL